MSRIPLGYTQMTMLFGGVAVPNGAACTFGVHITNSDTQEENAEFTFGLWSDTLQPQLTTACSLIGVLSKDGPNSTGSQFLYSGSETGGSGGEAVPPNTAVLIQKRTAFGGRKNRGRMYLPGFREDDVSGAGQITTVLSDLQTAADNFLTGLSANDMPMVVLHGNSSDPTVVTSLQVSSTVATQRRRLRR